MTQEAPKRFYKSVALHPEGDGFAVALDGRLAKTRGGHPLTAGPALAKVLLAEWDGQGEVIKLDTMPLSRIHGAIIDAAEADAGMWADTIAQYTARDLLCYRADDRRLAARQEDAFAPFLKRAGQDGISLVLTTGILPIDQPARSLAAAETKTASMDKAELFVRKLITEMTGSAILALYAHEDPDAAFAAARLDEAFQAEVWGVDHEAQQREDALRAEFDAALHYLALHTST